MNLEEAVKIQEKLLVFHLKEDIFINHGVGEYHGYLINKGESFYILEEDCESLQELPHYIKNKKDALSYLDNVNAGYRTGELIGVQDFKMRFHRFMAVI